MNLSRAEAAMLGRRAVQPVKAADELLAVFVPGVLVNPLNASAWGWQKRSRMAKRWKENVATALLESGWKSGAATAADPRAALFRAGRVTLHSGEVSNFKIDCDALTDADWEALANMIGDRVGRFSQAIGIPRGGLKLAEALNGVRWAVGDPLLIVDDVLTTGTSMERMRAQLLDGMPDREIKGAVVFARGPAPAWVTALFAMTPAPASARSAATPKVVAFLAHTGGRMDSDGLQASLKPCRDALVECGVLSGDADRDGHRFEYDQRIDRKQRGVVIRVRLSPGTRESSQA